MFGKPKLDRYFVQLHAADWSVSLCVYRWFIPIFNALAHHRRLYVFALPHIMSDDMCTLHELTENTIFVTGAQPSVTHLFYA